MGDDHGLGSALDFSEEIFFPSLYCYSVLYVLFFLILFLGSFANRLIIKNQIY